MNTAAPMDIPRWKTALNMMINPGEVIKTQMTKIPWPYSVMVSGLSFTLFFLQTGLDLLRNGQVGVSTVILITMLGLLYGTAGIALLAVMVWALSQAEAGLHPGMGHIYLCPGVFSYLRLCTERTDLFSGFWLEDCGGLWCYRGSMGTQTHLIYHQADVRGTSSLQYCHDYSLRSYPPNWLGNVGKIRWINSNLLSR